MKQENNMIQKGTILIAKNECAMNGNPNLKALIVGNHYVILAITSRNLVVKSEISDEHCFDLDSTDPSYWRNYFKLKNENNMKTPEEILKTTHSFLDDTLGRRYEESEVLSAMKEYATKCQQDNLVCDNCKTTKQTKVLEDCKCGNGKMWIGVSQCQQDKAEIQDELWGNVFAKIKQYGLNKEVLEQLKSNYFLTTLNKP